MKIKGIAVCYPGEEVDNTRLLQTVEKYSRSGNKDITKILDQTAYYLEISGSRSRYWSPASLNVRDVVQDTVHQALIDADMDPGDVDLVIHASVIRFFDEPGDSYFAAEATGMTNAKCFDISDACGSWSTAALLADDLLSMGRYRNAVIVNTELPMFPGKGAFPNAFKVNSMEEIDWKFPVQTVADCVTATVLTADGEPWKRCVKSDPVQAGLCFIPKVGADSFLAQCGSFPQVNYEEGVCTSFGKLLYQVGSRKTQEVLWEVGIPKSEMDCVIPHTSGKRMWHYGATVEGILDKTHFIYEKSGNVVSASFPAGLYDAIQAGKVKRGDTVVGWISAAGMSYSAYGFKF